MDNIPYLLALHSIDGLGPIRLKAILDYFKDPKLAWEANKDQLLKIGIPKGVIDLLIQTRQVLEPLSYQATIAESGIKWVSIYDDLYPKLLSQIYDPPIILYYLGQLLQKDEDAIAVVGTRKMTGYGRLVTRQFTQVFAQAGLTVVSGLARGVDSEAHQQTLDSHGRTIAVLGGGLKKIFPPENQQLADNISLNSGAVISEFPPNYPSLPGNFPARNRIIAGLSQAVLVTEADVDSGSLITARFALEAGREVFTVPGPITSNLSKGPISLINQGARAVFNPEEVLQELGVGLKQKSNMKNQNVENLSEDEQKILSCLESESLHIDEIGRKLIFPAAKISALLLKMEISGLVSSLGSGVYCKR